MRSAAVPNCDLRSVIGLAAYLLWLRRSNITSKADLGGLKASKSLGRSVILILLSEVTDSLHEKEAALPMLVPIEQTNAAGTEIQGVLAFAVIPSVLRNLAGPVATDVFRVWKANLEFALIKEQNQMPIKSAR